MGVIFIVVIIVIIVIIVSRNNKVKKTKKVCSNDNPKIKRESIANNLTEDKLQNTNFSSEDKSNNICSYGKIYETPSYPQTKEDKEELMNKVDNSDDNLRKYKEKQEYTLSKEEYIEKKEKEEEIKEIFAKESDYKEHLKTMSQLYNHSKGDEIKDKNIGFSDDNINHYIESLKNSSPVEVEVLNFDVRNNGYFDREKNKIIIKNNFEDKEAFEVLLSAVPEAIVYNQKEKVDLKAEKIKADSIKFIFYERFGIDNSNIDFSSVAEWSRDKDISDLESVLESVQQGSKALIDSMEKELINKMLKIEDEKDKEKQEHALSKEEYIEKKEMERKEIKEMFAKAEEKVYDFFSKESNYKEHLKTMTHLYEHSFINQILIKQQYPDATMVKSFNNWKIENNRDIEKGAKSITGISSYTTTKIMEDGEEKRFVNFKKEALFDVSQTKGDEIKDKNIGFSNDNLSHYVGSLKNSSPAEVLSLDIRNNGYFDRDNNKIIIKNKLEDKEAFEVLLSAVPEAIVYNQKVYNQKEKVDLKAEKIKADSIKFIFCERFGIDNSNIDFSSVVDWAKDKDINELKSVLTSINKGAKSFVKSMERKLDFRLNIAPKLPKLEKNPNSTKEKDKIPLNEKIDSAKDKNISEAKKEITKKKDKDLKNPKL